jgi:thiamine-phosphate pyrophosphorylase
MRVARLHLITPETLDAATRAGLEAALDAGVRWVQVRTKKGTDRYRYEAARSVVAAGRRVGATCLVNDRADLALAAGAHGVHLGLDDLPVAAVRAVVPAGFVVGATVRNPDQARRAVAEGATYLGVGPVYRTATKAGLPEPIGPRGLAAVVGAAGDVPVVAISGVTVGRVPEVLAAGAHGVAVVAAVFAARIPSDRTGGTGPGAAARALLDALGVPGADADGDLGAAGEPGGGGDGHRGGAGPGGAPDRAGAGPDGAGGPADVTSAAVR